MWIYSHGVGWKNNYYMDTSEITIGFLLKTGQSDQTSPGSWWGMRNLIRYVKWEDIKGGRFWLNWLRWLPDETEFYMEVHRPQRMFRNLSKAEVVTLAHDKCWFGLITNSVIQGTFKKLFNCFSVIPIFVGYRDNVHPPICILELFLSLY